MNLRTSRALVKIGIAWLTIGTLWTIFPNPTREHGMAWSPLLNLWVGAALWWVSGIAALVAVAWPARRENLLPLAMFAPGFLALVFAVSSFISLLPNEWVPGGKGSAIVTAVSYATFWVLASEAVSREEHS